MKIMIKREDYVRLFIISKKINEANLNDDDLVDIKIKYYAFMAIYYNYVNKYSETSKCYKTVWETVKKSKGKNLPNKVDFDFSVSEEDTLANFLGFLVLESHSAHQQK